MGLYIEKANFAPFKPSWYMSFPLLEAIHVSKRFGDKVVLDDISTSFDKGRIYGLLGPNGAGKTTFIRIITRIYFPDSGEVRYRGMPIAPIHVRRIGYLPEERGLYQKYKVGEQLMLLTQLKGVDRSEARRRLEWWLDRFEARSWWNRRVNELSKGMQQKLQFILTVVHDPELIILDEPFTGFGPINTELVKEEILRLRNEGKCIIFSTHRMEQVEELCEQILLVNAARLLVDEPKHELKDRYRTNRYEVVVEGDQVAFPEGPWHIVESMAEGRGRRLIVELESVEALPQLLQRLAHEQVHIRRIAEQIPSLHDIFIKLANRTSNEAIAPDYRV